MSFCVDGNVWHVPEQKQETTYCRRQLDASLSESSHFPRPPVAGESPGWQPSALDLSAPFQQ